jgi:hypothetical protein
MKKYFEVTILIIIVLILAVSGLFVLSPREGEKGFRYLIYKAAGEPCDYHGQQVFSRRLTDRIPSYLTQSSSTGIKKSRNREELMEQVAARKLVRVRNGRGYNLEDFSHSYPYLTKDAALLLREIAKRFTKKISSTGSRGASFTVTSMTRTGEDVNELRNGNSNASENSPHFNGNAFDISYVTFITRNWYLTECDKYYLKEALAEVIHGLRAEKKCWATYEINQGCFHVVSRVSD